MAYIAPHSPVADWRCVPEGVGYGNYFDPVSGTWATVTRTTPKTTRTADGRIVDVPAGKLALEPWSLHKEGGVGHAAIIEEARTNYLTNSYGAASTNGLWDGVQISGNRTASVTTSIGSNSIYGSTPQRVQYTGGVSDVSGDKSLSIISPESAIGTFAPNEVAIASCYLSGSLTGVSMKIVIQALSAAGALLGSVSTAVTGLSDTPMRYSSVYRSLPATTSKCRFYIGIADIGTGDTIDCTFDACQLEKGSFATSYIPTTAAAVTRAGDVVSVPTTGWIETAFSVLAVHAKDFIAPSQNVLSWAKDATGFNRIVLYGISSNAMLLVNSTLAIGANPSGAIVHAGVFDSVGLSSRCYVNGTGGTAISTSAAPVGMIDTAHIGSYRGLGDYLNGPIARLTVYDKALTDAQLAAADMTTDLLTGLDTARVTNEVTL